MKHGWEPDVAVEDTVLRRFVYAYADRTATMATALGGRTRMATFSSMTRSRRKNRRKARTADSLRAIVDGSLPSNNDAR